MFKKYKSLLPAIYISFFVPITTTYLLSILQGAILGINNKGYYLIKLLDYTTLAVLIIAIFLIISTYFICRKEYHEIFYCIMGIFIGLASRVLPISNTSGILDHSTFILRGILTAGYLTLIVYILLQNKNSINKRPAKK